MLNLPRLVTASDYHEFDSIQSTLRQLGVKSVKVAELDLKSLYAGPYVAIVYTGRQPSKDEAIALAKVQKITLQTDEDYV